MKSEIDLNLDAGENAEALANGSEAALYDLVSSVNIACGGHAGDAQTMATAVTMAKSRGLAIGAHPSYPDRKNFGRQRMEIDSRQLTEALRKQISDLQAICSKNGVRLSHVKPHGALYNVAADDRESANAIFAAVRAIDTNLAVVGLFGSPFIDWCRAAGLRAFGEAFVDRTYESNGRLRARSQPDALIEKPELAAAQALRLLESGADTLCIHGDSPNAQQIAAAVREELQRIGIRIHHLPGVS